MAEKEGGFGQNVLGKLKLVGGKVVDFGGTVAGRVVDVGGTLGDKIGDIGNKIVDVATKPLFESDFERLRQLNQIAKQQQDLRRKYTEEELAAVEAKADLVLGQLYPGYFEANFDPVAYELSKIDESDNQDHIEELVERLTQGVETVSGRLSRHVNKKRDVLLAGIDRVAEVEDDLKAAFMISRSSRATLKAAAEEVGRNMRVVGQSRRKQSYMELMEVVGKIKRARDLQGLLKRAQELGEYGDAIMTCVQCFQGVDSLRQLTVSSELRATVQRLYLDTLRRMDAALTNICAEFDPAKYTKILEGYLLQGIPPRSLGDKVLQCFKEAIHDATTRVVRSLLLTKPKLADRLASGSASSSSSALQLGYPELLRALPPDLLRPCLLRLLEVLFDTLASYHAMAHWHGLALQRQAQVAEQAEGLDDEARRAQAATTSFLAAVYDMMRVSRPEVLEVGARRIRELLLLDSLFKGEDFMQVVDWCGRFGGMAEAFLGGPCEIKPQVMSLCARFLPAYHRSNLESLTTCLNNEAWQDVAAATGGAGAAAAASRLQLDAAILHSPLYVPGWGEEGAGAPFEQWMAEGNPFKRGSGAGAGPPEGRQRSLLELLAKTSAEELPGGTAGPHPHPQQLSRTPSQHSNMTDQAGGVAGAAGSSTPTAATTPAFSPDFGGLEEEGGRPAGSAVTGPAAGGGAAAAAAPAQAAAGVQGAGAGSSSSGSGSAGSSGAAGAGAAPQPAAGASGRPAAVASVAAGQPGPAGGGSGGVPPAAAAAGAPAGAMLTISSQQALKYIKHYGQIMRPLQGHSESLFRCLAEIFDVYLLYCFSAFGGMGLEDLVWRDDVISARLKGALLRILTAEGSKYRTLVEELGRNRPTGRGAPIASTGLGLLDRFGDKMESLADSMERSVNRMAVKLGDSRVMQAMAGGVEGGGGGGGGAGGSGGGGGPGGGYYPGAGGGGIAVQGSGASLVGLSQVSVTSSNSGMLTPLAPPRPGGGAGGGSNSSTPDHGGMGGGGGGGGGGAGGTLYGGGSPGGSSHARQQWGLRERVVAVESLLHLAGELKAAKQAIILALPGRCQREVEAYFSRTVEAAGDLRDHLFKAAARAMMQGVWDSDRGIPAAISVTDYNVRSPADKHSPWADFTVAALERFRARVAAAGLPGGLAGALWEHALGVVVEGLLGGLAAVRRCTLMGRANMSLDLAHVEKQLRLMKQPTAPLAVVDAYIKAFYLPWEELPGWCQSHLSQYGKQRLFTLIEVSAEFNKVRRGAKNEVLEMIEALDPARSF